MSTVAHDLDAALHGQVPLPVLRLNRVGLVGQLVRQRAFYVVSGDDHSVKLVPAPILEKGTGNPIFHHVRRSQHDTRARRGALRQNSSFLLLPREHLLFLRLLAFVLRLSLLLNFPRLLDLLRMFYVHVFDVAQLPRTSFAERFRPRAAAVLECFVDPRSARRLCTGVVDRVLLQVGVLCPVVIKKQH